MTRSDLSQPAVSGLRVLPSLSSEFAEILTPAALRFVEGLLRAFGPVRIPHEEYVPGQLPGAHADVIGPPFRALDELRGSAAHVVLRLAPARGPVR